jgi:hypothetical protein
LIEPSISVQQHRTSRLCQSSDEAERPSAQYSQSTSGSKVNMRVMTTIPIDDQASDDGLTSQKSASSPEPMDGDGDSFAVLSPKEIAMQLGIDLSDHRAEEEDVDPGELEEAIKMANDLDDDF